MKHIKEKSRTRQQRQRMRAHRRSMVLISSVIMLLIVLVSVGGSHYGQDEAYKKQQAELETQIKEEKDRTKEIEKYKEYVGTDAYVEDVAKGKFGLVYEDEIVLKPNKIIRLQMITLGNNWIS